MSETGGQSQQSTDVQAELTTLKNELAKQRDLTQTWMSKATHYEKTLDGKDPIALIEAAKERDLLAKAQAVGDPQKFEAELERRSNSIRQEFAPKLEEKDKELSSVKSKLKDLLIVDRVFSKASDQIYPKAADDFKAYVRAVCDLDENEEIIVKDSSGKIRYSPNNPSKPMQVDELIKELSEQKDHWFTNKTPQGGKMGGEKIVTASGDWNLASLSKLSADEQKQVLAKMTPEQRQKIASEIRF